LAEYKTYSALGAAVANSLGVPDTVVEAVPTPDVQRDRTYASALAARDWLKARGDLPESINVVTVGAHARRTRLLYRKAFGEGCEIGIIMVDNVDYDAGRWWAYSQGVRTIIGETAAYLYARFLFESSADVERE
jgi:hypothetical protein